MQSNTIEVCFNCLHKRQRQELRAEGLLLVDAMPLDITIVSMLDWGRKSISFPGIVVADTTANTNSGSKHM